VKEDRRKNRIREIILRGDELREGWGITAGEKNSAVTSWAKLEMTGPS